MYKRIRKWIDAISPTAHTESGWENSFTTEEDEAIDIRFTLTGYGWKPNAGDENIKALEKGSYKIYLRENGESTWNLLGRVECDRAGTDASTVYKSVGFATGLLSAGKYDIKIVADKAAKFTAWGGALEGIISGGQFWSGLQVRTFSYRSPSGYDEMAITENVGVQLV